MILKTFDPKKADTIFTEEGEVSWMHITSTHRYIIIIIIRLIFSLYFTNSTQMNEYIVKICILLVTMNGYC
jgi:hypothetical protein